MYRLTTINFYRKITNFLFPIFILVFFVSLGAGLYQSLIVSPIDYQQGEMVRIMYIHVPAAWMSLFIYSFIFCCSLSTLVWQARFTYILAISAAPIGAVFALITLITGSIWGKPIWGAWWVWDARLTSMLILFLLYMGYIALYNSGNNIWRAQKPASVLAIIGFINVPIVKFSVDIWNSLHQSASIMRKGGVAIDGSMLSPLILMFICFICFFALLMIIRTNTYLIILKKQRSMLI